MGEADPAEDITNVLSVGATFTVIESAINELDDCRLADEEVALILGFPEELRVGLTSRLHQLAGMLQDALLDLKANVLVLRGAEVAAA